MASFHCRRGQSVLGREAPTAQRHSHVGGHGAGRDFRRYCPALVRTKLLRSEQRCLLVHSNEDVPFSHWSLHILSGDPLPKFIPGPRASKDAEVLCPLQRILDLILELTTTYS